jgi:hypothetical protein
VGLGGLRTSSNPGFARVDTSRLQRRRGFVLTEASSSCFPSSDGKFSRAVKPEIFTVRFTVKLESTPFFRMERSREEILRRANGMGCIFQAVDHV